MLFFNYIFIVCNLILFEVCNFINPLKNILEQKITHYIVKIFPREFLPNPESDFDFQISKVSTNSASVVGG